MKKLLIALSLFLTVTPIALSAMLDISGIYKLDEEVYGTNDRPINFVVVHNESEVAVFAGVDTWVGFPRTDYLGFEKISFDIPNLVGFMRNPSNWDGNWRRAYFGSEWENILFRVILKNNEIVAQKFDGYIKDRPYSAAIYMKDNDHNLLIKSYSSLNKEDLDRIETLPPTNIRKLEKISVETVIRPVLARIHYTNDLRWAVWERRGSDFQWKPTDCPTFYSRPQYHPTAMGFKIQSVLNGLDKAKAYICKASFLVWTEHPGAKALKYISQLDDCIEDNRPQSCKWEDFHYQP